jgi:hypothetical protein
MFLFENPLQVSTLLLGEDVLKNGRNMQLIFN